MGMIVEELRKMQKDNKKTSTIVWVSLALSAVAAVTGVIQVTK